MRLNKKNNISNKNIIYKMAPKNSKKSGEKKVKKVVDKKVVKSAPKVEEEVVEPEPVVQEKAPVDVVSEEVSMTPYMDDFSVLLTELDTAVSTIRALRSRVQKLEKQVHRDYKVTQKKLRGKKRRVVDPDAQPSGFAKPGPVSDELRKFLSLADDELIARTSVTKRINGYCKEHDLQDESDRRKINADAPLRKLLRMSKEDKLTFFNLQTYMKVHFPNKEGVYPTV